MYLFADDCIIYLDGNNWTQIAGKIQSDLVKIETWCSENALSVNASKTKALIVGSHSRLNTINFDVKFCLIEKDIQYVNHFRYLGVILDSEMSLKYLLSVVKKKSSNKIFMLRKLRRYITLDSAILIYKQAIMPIFDYSGFMVLFLGVEDKRELQIMQNDALRFCFNVRLSDHVTIVELHARSKLSSLEQRIIRQLLGLQYLLYKKDTDCMITRVNTRSQQKYVFKVNTKIGKKYERSPYYIGTCLWNKMSKTVQD